MVLLRAVVVDLLFIRFFVVVWLIPLVLFRMLENRDTETDSGGDEGGDGIKV